MATTNTISLGTIPRIAIMFAIIMSALAASLTAPSVSAQTDGDCRLDKISTANEIQGAGLQRMEIGGGGTQHVDYYVPGHPSVSYIVGPQEEPHIWFGHGSIWEGNGPECENFDYVADARGYITGDDWREVERRDDGHSGVLVDLRDGEVYNFGELNEAEVDDLLAFYEAGIAGDMDTNDDGLGDGSGEPTDCTNTGEAYGGIEGCMPGSDSSGDSSDGDTDAGGQQANCDVESVQHDPATGPVTFNVEQGGAVYFQFWTNEPGVEQAEHRVFIDEPGSYSLNGGGTYFVFPAGCANEAQSQYDDDNRPEWTLEDLEGFGLVN